jgi:two-component system NtrC family response regulator
MLLIDDDPVFCEMMRGLLAQLGHSCEIRETLKHGISEAQSGNYDIILLDVVLPDGNGLQELSAFHSIGSAPEIIVLTANSDPEGAELAIKQGAWDYVEKPASQSTLQLLINRALRYREKKLDYIQRKTLKRDSIIGKSQKLDSCLELLIHASNSSGNVLITGATGTGKELFARAIHENSERANAKFIVVDCTSIPPTLAESLLFGHLKGSFTGAHMDKEGLIEQAHGGTLFLDEIGDLTMDVQKSLLRVLQERSYRPIGSKREKTSDFHLIAATNRDLEKMVAESRFRKDLYYRLSTLTIQLPTLSERMEDLVPLIEHYAPRICKEGGYPEKTVSKEFFDSLSRYDWPGNVRELKNVLATCISNSMDENVIYPYHLPVDLRAHLAKKNLKDKHTPGEEDTASSVTAPDVVVETIMNSPTFPTFKETREKAVSRTESMYLKELMRHCEYNVNEACEISKLSRARLYELLKKHGVQLRTK